MPTLMCMHLEHAPYPQMSALIVTKKQGPGKDGDYCLHFQVTPLTALKFAELTVKAGFPKGVINIIPGSGKPGQEGTDSVLTAEWLKELSAASRCSLSPK